MLFYDKRTKTVGTNKGGDRYELVFSLKGSSSGRVEYISTFAPKFADAETAESYLNSIFLPFTQRGSGRVISKADVDVTDEDLYREVTKLRNGLIEVRKNLGKIKTEVQASLYHEEVGGLRFSFDFDEKLPTWQDSDDVHFLYREMTDAENNDNIDLAKRILDKILKIHAQDDLR